MRHWVLPKAQTEEVKKLAEEHQLSSVVAKVLCGRGIIDPGEIAALLEGDRELADPFSLVDMDKAVQRIWQAIEENQRIVVYGDYDCDGVVSTALLYSYLEVVGADVLHYIPDREVEGYGLNKQAIQFLHDIRKVELIITVDNGIAAVEEIAYASSLGIDVVVTDHHSPQETLPEAVAVVDPHRVDCPSQFKHLAGVGVAFKLVCAMEQSDGSDLLEYYGDLLCLGTVGDVVTLTGENRLLVKEGLKVLTETGRPGLRELMKVSGVADREITAETVAFSLVPRINAAGRMGDVYEALELLLTESESRAEELAGILNDYNIARKATENQILADVGDRLLRDASPLYERALLLEGEGWHHGVIGILCSRLVERYGKACFLVANADGQGRASGRSVPGVSMIETLMACDDLLERYGGHPMAAGFTVKSENFAALRERFSAVMKEKYPTPPPNSLVVDAVLSPGELDAKQIDSLSALAPFGEGNKKPVFAILDATLAAIQPIGEGKHLRLGFEKDGGKFTALYFGMTAPDLPFVVGDRVDLAFQVSLDSYRGALQVTVKLQDMKLAGVDQEALLAGSLGYDAVLRDELDEEQLRAIVPTREEIGIVYRYLRKAEGYPYGCDMLYGRLDGISYEKMMISLTVLEELELIRTEGFYREKKIRLLPVAGKVDLGSSQTLLALAGQGGA